MESFSCEECRAIYQEMLQASWPAQETTPQSITAFLEGLNPEECARMRVASPLWMVWRRMQEHRVRTGHVVSPLGPPAGLNNLN